jgi:DNA polymerase-3 subunit epsilon
MREIVFDTETTGLSPLGGDRIVEIGCVELMNRVPTGRSFHAYFNPCRPMPSEAEAVHGLSEVFLSDKPLFTDQCDQLLDFIGDAPLVAHNAPFDFGFLTHELALCGLPSVCMTRMICTLVLARQRLPGAKHTLDALCTRFGVDRSIRIKHGALIDAQLLAQVYVELTGGRQIGLGLVAEERSSEEKIDVLLVQEYANSITVQPPRPHEPSAEELERHAEFLKGITDPIWHRVAATS